jgi:hypothetical protein
MSRQLIADKAETICFRLREITSYYCVQRNYELSLKILMLYVCIYVYIEKKEEEEILID